MLYFRKKLISTELFDWTMILYCKFRRKKAWGITTEMLLGMPTNTFGYYLGSFLKERNFSLIPKVERHDAYHVLTGYGTNGIRKRNCFTVLLFWERQTYSISLRCAIARARLLSSSRLPWLLYKIISFWKANQLISSL